MMKRILQLTALLVLLALCCTAALADDESATTMRLAMTEGTFRVTDKAGNEIAASEDMRLFGGYTVETGAHSYAWITLDATKVCKLDENSSVLIDKKDRLLRLQVLGGNLFFNVTEKLNDNESMEITTATMVTGIRGTSGEVRVADGESTFSLLDGVVSVHAADVRGNATGKAITLQAGQKVTAAFKNPEAAAKNNGRGVSALQEPAGLTAQDLSYATLAELVNDKALQKRVPGELVQSAVPAYEERLDEMRANLSDGTCIHDYPATMQRTYVMNSSKEFMTAKVSCALCGSELTETEPLRRSTITAPTCTEEGSDLLSVHFMAAPFSDQTRTDVTSPLGHHWENPQYSWSGSRSSCSISVTCSRDASHTASANATVRHNVEQDATCTEPEMTRYTAFAVFDGQRFNTFAMVRSGDPTGHTYGEATFSWAGTPACTATVVCLNDASHTLSKDCGITLADHGGECTGAWEDYTASVTFPSGTFTDTARYDNAHAHVWGTASYSWNVGDATASCTATHTCMCDCGCRAEESPTASGLTLSTVTPATCTATGQAEYVAVFPDGFTTQTYPVTLPMTDHTWGTPSYSWNNLNCTASASCTACAQPLTETQTAGWETLKAVTCRQDGSERAVVTFSNPIFEKQYGGTVDVPRLNHTYACSDYEWSSDMSSCKGTFSCTICGGMYVIVTVSGSSISSVITVQPTTESEGTRVYTASFSKVKHGSDDGPGTTGITTQKSVSIPRLN